MNVLIIGLGSIGKRHLNNILEHREEWGIEEVTAFDVDVDTWRGLDGIRGDYTFICDQRYLSSTSVDVAIICTPPKYHYGYAVATRQAHVLIEKPLTYNLPWEDEYSMGMGRKGRLVLAAMNLRFHKGVSWARGQVKDGVVGTPLLGKAWYGYNGILKNRPDSPDAKLGPLVSAIHDLDVLLWVLTGGMGGTLNITKHSGWWRWGVAYGQIKWQDPNTPILGIRLEADFLAHVRRRGMHIIGEDGEVLIEATGTGIEHIVNIVNEELKWEGQNDVNDMYVEELASFFALCRGDIKREESRLPDVLEVLKLAKALGVKQDGF